MRAQRLLRSESKFNPNHDPLNGQFTSGPGSNQGQQGASRQDKEPAVTASRERIHQAKPEQNPGRLQSSGQYHRSSIRSAADAETLVANQNGNYLGKDSQCASLTRALAPDVGPASTWQRGEKVQGNTNIPAGTPIATFNYHADAGTNGYGPARAPGGISHSSHTGIYLGQDEKGIWILHQYAKSGGPRVTRIPWNAWK